MTTPASPTAAPATNGVDRSTETADAVRPIIDQLLRNGKADLAFGTPTTVGDRTLIPVARVMYGFGGGSGPDSTQRRGSGAGGGLGVRPIAMIEATHNGVRVLPIVDVQSMLGRVFGFATAALLFAAFMQRARGRHGSSRVTIGRIEPHLSVGGPRLGFRPPRSGGMLGKLLPSSSHPSR